jgi:magnesium chelatase family protein
VLSIARRFQSRATNRDTLIVPPANLQEASLVRGIRLAAPSTLAELVNALRDRKLRIGHARVAPPATREEFDLGDVAGQEGARRALEIAAAGSHGLLLVGPPGAGKTMLARRLPTILPALTDAEALEVTAVHSVAGLLDPRTGAVVRRPFPPRGWSVAAACRGRVK